MARDLTVWIGQGIDEGNVLVISNSEENVAILIYEHAGAIPYSVARDLSSPDEEVLRSKRKKKG